MDVDPGVVEAVARQALHVEDGSLRDWSIEPLGGGASGEIGLTAGVRRVRGVLDVGGTPSDWSAILKVLQRSEIEIAGVSVEVDDPRSPDYWRREAEAYGSGLLTDLGDRLVAPRCYRVDRVSGSAIALWLEDTPDSGPRAWSMSGYEAAARRLGAFNGRTLAEPYDERLPWLSRGRLRPWLEWGEPGIASMRASRRAGFMSDWLDDAAVGRVERLWGERERLLDALESLPTTLCHHDAHRRNLGSRTRDGTVETIALDWQFLGTGHLGEEVATMVAVSLQFMDVPVAEAQALEHHVLGGYVAGLRTAGWAGDAADVRFGFACAAALFMGVAAAGVWVRMLADEASEDLTERMIGRPLPAIAAQWAPMQEYLMDLGDEALATIGS